MEFASNPMRQIEIRTTANGGYLVHVGCTYFAYEDKEKLIKDLSEYIRDPEAVEKEYNKHHKAYDEVERAPRSLGRLQETTGQSEANEPMESMEESGY